MISSTNTQENQENKIKYLPNLLLKSAEKPKTDRVLHERYWSSSEEQKILELWCKYQDEVTEFDDNNPIFKTIAEDMKEFGYQLTTRECRRRMSSWKNKFHAEKRTIEGNTSEKPSTWRLYPLLECILEETNVKGNPLHMDMIVEDLFTEMNLANPPYLADPKPAEEIFKSALVRTRSTAKASRPTAPRPPAVSLSLSKHSRSSIMPIRRVTPALIAEIKCDIRRMEQKRDIDLKRLRLEQNDYYNSLAMFEHAQRQLEGILRRLRLEGRT